MSYATREESDRDGAPVDLYAFTVGATVFRYTSADTNQLVGSDLFTKEAITRGEITIANEDSDGTLEIVLPRTHPVPAFFIAYLPEPPMTVEVFQKHRLDSGVERIFAGNVANVRFTAGRSVVTCSPDWAALRSSFPRNRFTTQCNWALYSAQCGVARSAFQVAGTITTITGREVQASAFSSKPDGYFANGYLERADGSRRWIVKHVGSTLTLASPFVGLVVNDIVQAFAGCDRTESDCATKFSNLDRHLGFALIPTKNPFTGSIQ